jgi:hypothetical protein
MTELGPNARSLIDLAHGEDDPDDAARQRVHEAFCTRVHSGHAAGSGHGLPHSAVPLALKPGTWLAVLAAAVGGGWAVYSQYATAPGAAAMPSSSLVALASPTSLAVRVERVQPPVREGQEAAISTPRAGSSDSSLHTTRAPRATGTLSERAATPAQGSEGPSSAETRERIAGEPGLVRALPVEGSPPGQASLENDERSDSDPDAALASGPKRATLRNEALLAEAQALREVQKLLRAGNSARALTRLAEQDREFANGQLHEARAAARAMAVCTSQSAEAKQTTASAFAARWPRSILLSSVRSACQSQRSPVAEGTD